MKVADFGLSCLVWEDKLPGRDVSSKNVACLAPEARAHPAPLAASGGREPPRRPSGAKLAGKMGGTALQVIRGESYGSPSDVFSFGCVLWSCASMKEPWSEYKYNRFRNATVGRLVRSGRARARVGRRASSTTAHSAM